MAPINTTPAPFTIQLPALVPQAPPPAGVCLLYFDQVSGKLKAIDSTGTSVLVGVVNGAAGADADVQFNDGGGLAGDADFTWDQTTGSLSATGGTAGQSFLAVGVSASNFIEVGGNTSVDGNAVAISAGEPGATASITADGDVELFSQSASVTLIAAAGPIVIEVTHDGKLGFFAHAAAVKPTVTGSKGANAALTSLLTALAGLGLLTDSSS